MNSDPNIKANQLAIMTLSLGLGVITPLLARRTYDGVFGAKRNRILHKLNAVHNFLYFNLTLSTILVKIFIPVASYCWAFRFAQGLLFHAYVINYELVIGIKAKAIIGNRILIRFADFSVGTTLLILSLSIRAFTALMSVWHANYAFSVKYGLCVNVFHPGWQDLSNYTRNILEIFWSAIFVIPLYRVVRDSKKAGAVAIDRGDIFLPAVDDPEKINSRRSSKRAVLPKTATAMQNLLFSSMIFPFCASLISIALSIYMNIDLDVHPAWASIMHGVQNFVSTLSLNLILNIRVAEHEPAHCDNCDHVRTYDARGTPNRRRYRDTESFDEWESTDHETSRSESAQRKPSTVVSFDLHHDTSPSTDNINRRPIPRDVTPASPRRSSLATLPTTMRNNNANVTNNAMESLVPLPSIFSCQNPHLSSSSSSSHSSDEELFSSSSKV